MNLTYDVTQISVCIPITVEQFKKLDQIDYLDVVMPTLQKLGASDIEYNGHFGPNVSLSVEDQSALPPIMAKIAEFIGATDEIAPAQGSADRAALAAGSKDSKGGANADQA